MNSSLPFKSNPKARASLKPGTLYAIDGGDGHIYFGQVDNEKSLGFFKFRSTTIPEFDELLKQPIMSRLGINYRLIGSAIRNGKWLKLGITNLHKDLSSPQLLVLWSVGTLEVEIWEGNQMIKTTKAHDPEIQEYEIMAVYESEQSISERLVADFHDQVDNWEVGGSVRRKRIMKEKLAKRFPEQPWHQLPGDWIYVQ